MPPAEVPGHRRKSCSRAFATPGDAAGPGERKRGRRGAFNDVVSLIEPLGVESWPDFMRLVGAFAALGRWQDALRELRTRHERWQGAPELLSMEAVALALLGDEAGVARHCHAALEATRGTQHPERAYWAARACLVRATVAAAERAEIEHRSHVSYADLPGALPRSVLEGAMLLRTGRSREAFEALHCAVPPRAAREAQRDSSPWRQSVPA